jgi:hypothetical protein
VTLIQSLYIVDSSGVCLFSLPLASVKQFEPNLLSGFIVAECECFRYAFGEDTKRLSLERREILIRNVGLKTRDLLLVIVHALNSEKENGYTEVLLDHLSKALRKKGHVVRRLPKGVADESDTAFKEIVESTLKSIPCPHLVKGFMGITDHCQKVDSPIKSNQSCDFAYATRLCQYYKDTAWKEKGTQGIQPESGDNVHDDNSQSQ